ncbi:MAG TPA: hypothetical protein VMP11_07460 [Verrucomicrobiae bacterium]|nr:hypothetical protein [Verrucomicrobiae bacterium]
MNFFRSYLLAYLMWLGVPLGCLVVLMIHHIAGGRWGFSVRRVLEAATRTIPWMLVLFLPIVIGMKQLYPWTQPTTDEALLHKRPYLNTPFFVARAVVYFAVWIGLAALVNRWADRLEHEHSPELSHRLRGLCGVGLGLYGLTISFAAVDWVMSLEPHWFSTIYGVMLGVGQVLSGLAVTIIVAARLARDKTFAETAGAQQFHDLGNLLLTFVILWAYMAYSQYLVIWSGNLRDEIPWYIMRSRGGWQWVAVALIVLHFAVPFFFLLSRDLKRTAAKLAGLAVGLLVMRQVDLWWIVTPNFYPTLHISWLDVTLTVAMGALWFWLFGRQLEARPLVPAYDATIEEEVVTHG